MTTIIEYCPMCEARPKKPQHQDPLNPRVSVPKICLSDRAINGQLIAEIIAAGKVKVIPPGKSARDKEDHKKSLLNLTGQHSPKTNRSKNQPP